MNQILSDIRHLPSKSAVNSHEGKLLYDLAGRVPENGIIVEIGSCTGISTCYLAAGSKVTVKVHAVDLWTLGLGITALASSAIEKTFHANIEAMGFQDRVIPMKGFSEDMVKNWTQPIDLLHIDGDHSYEGVKKDFQLWSPFLKKGGTIVFHDADRYDTVGRLIREAVEPGAKKILQVQKVWSAILP